LPLAKRIFSLCCGSAFFAFRLGTALIALGYECRQARKAGRFAQLAIDAIAVVKVDSGIA